MCNAANDQTNAEGFGRDLRLEKHGCPQTSLSDAAEVGHSEIF